jgi:CRISPR/Cas system Type II protein with McrA/HNH and RuvC-like nuclease domain
MERAFALRLAGVEKAGALSAAELVVCLRHILGLRGYHWRRSGESEGTFPWGDKEPLSRECREWMASEYITDETARAVRAMLPPDISEEDAREMEQLLAAATVNIRNSLNRLWSAWYEQLEEGAVT